MSHLAADKWRRKTCWESGTRCLFRGESHVTNIRGNGHVGLPPLHDSCQIIIGLPDMTHRVWTTMGATVKQITRGLTFGKAVLTPLREGCLTGAPTPLSAIMWLDEPRRLDTYIAQRFILIPASRYIYINPAPCAFWLIWLSYFP